MHIKSLIITALAFVAVGQASLPNQSALAQDQSANVSVIEMFTSQGCSSCPPADALIKGFDEQKDVIALAYHVNYWDYLGWKDTLGSEKNTQRQYDYSHSFGGNSVYTPQAVINGQDHVVGSHPAKIKSMLANHKSAGKTPSVPITIGIKDGDLSINVGAKTDLQTKGNVVVIKYNKASDVKIKRGENHGRTITYINSVTDILPIGMWDGNALHIDLPAATINDKNTGIAVLLQTKQGSILGAAQLK